MQGAWGAAWLVSNTNKRGNIIHSSHSATLDVRRPPWGILDGGAGTPHGPHSTYVSTLFGASGNRFNGALAPGVPQRNTLIHPPGCEIPEAAKQRN